MRFARIMISLATATLVLAACANQQKPAENAVARVEASLAEVRADAEKYAAEDLKAVDESVTNLKNNMARKDYTAVVRLAPSVTTAVTALKTKVAQAKSEAEANLAAAQAEWTELSASVPQMVETLQSRVDTLTKTRKLPKDMVKAAFDAAKSGVEEIKTAWTEAGADFAEGKASEALRKARAVKARSAELIEQLGAKVS
jgi:hypothetical protein